MGRNVLLWRTESCRIWLHIDFSERVCCPICCVVVLFFDFPKDWRGKDLRNVTKYHLIQCYLDHKLCDIITCIVGYATTNDVNNERMLWRFPEDWRGKSLRNVTKYHLIQCYLDHKLCDIITCIVGYATTNDVNNERMLWRTGFFYQ